MHRTRFALLVPLALAAIAIGPRAAAPAPPPRDGERVVFLGDSITHAGMYIQYVEAYFQTRFPGRRIELLNLGLPSEGVTGLSEPEHPFPRPDVHERLERVLTMTRPQRVVACYGMNDAIYYPFSPERLTKYQQGVRRLVERARRGGAQVTLLTPPPFDPAPLEGKALPEGAPRFSWLRPFVGYDGVLQRYGAWLLTQNTKELPVIDLRGPITHHLAAARRSQRRYRLAGDGVHIDATGHWLIAAALLGAWDVPAEVDAAEIDGAAPLALRGRVEELEGSPEGGLRFSWTTRVPLARDPRWAPTLAARERFAERFNRHVLRVTGLRAPRYALYEDAARIGEATREELAQGVDLTTLPSLSTNGRAAAVLRLVQERHRLLDPAWLSYVGHKRPNTPAGLPLETARRRVEPLDAQLRTLTAPLRLRLRLSPL